MTLTEVANLASVALIPAIIAMSAWLLRVRDRLLVIEQTLSALNDRSDDQGHRVAAVETSVGAITTHMARIEGKLDMMLARCYGRAAVPPTECHRGD